ncbi:hypothetical protein [Mucilaginibacter agri]|uniref:O-antigen ligase domain-containing protein n=1 Tax=Mucilaginibacter agri TaxID=2695265 RepID=A0A965ZMP3_9SPHI|nr:hypothetical protein [Mucilaginibacter agri]NCD72407.1 hypothetical protein [Mucilaginibacter agri]
MQLNSQLDFGHTASSTVLFKKYVNFLMLFFPITSFLVIPTIPGTTIITFFAAILVMMIIMAPGDDAKEQFILELTYFMLIIIALSIISQMINLIETLKLPRTIILVNIKGFTKTFYRLSHLTQTLQLIVAFTIYLLVKHFSNDNIIKYIFWGLRLLCFYGLFEFVFYLLFHVNGDFISNRTFGDSKPGSLFQTIAIGGFGLVRMTSYTGEPSMFVFTVFPFWVLAVGLKRRFDSALLLCCLILSFSTTAYMCILIFTTGLMIYKKQFKLLFYSLIVIAAFCFALQLDLFKHLADSVYKSVFAGKVNGSTASSRDRAGHFYEHFDYWLSFNSFNQLFGIGFGYVRSTDFISTLLVNNGVIGVALITGFFYKKLLFKHKNEISKYYKVGVILLYFILMGTVPEFSYPSLWIFLALQYKLDRKEEGVPQTQLLNFNRSANNDIELQHPKFV